MSETKKQAARIIGNYTRLLLTLALGIAVVPLTIRWLGDYAFGIISLLGAGLGLAAIFSVIIQRSLVRELGHAYHADDDTFKRHYATVCQIAIVCSLLSVLSFALVLILVPHFDIPPELVTPARWFVFGQGFYTAIMTLLSPMLNMYLVKERFIGYNIWFVGVRATNILSVLILGYVFIIDDPAKGLTYHGILWASLAVLGMIIASYIIIRSDSRLRFTTKGSDKDARSQVLSTFSWNTGVQVAMNLHELVPPLLMNFFVGPLANAAWGIGFRFVSYIRMCTTGVQFGSDAVSARLSSGDDPDLVRAQLQRLIGIQTKLTSMIALPAAVVVFIYSWPIFDLWVGSSLKDYNAVMPYAVYMSRILAVALGARAISETWIIILYGSGHVKAYAPWIFIGGITAPIASVILMLTLPEHLVIYAPPVMYALILVAVHLLGLPLITARCLHIKASSLLFSLIRPAIATTIAASASIAILHFTNHLQDLGFTGTLTLDRGQTISTTHILAALATFTAVYAILSYAIVFDQSERARILAIVKSIKARITNRPVNQPPA